MNRLLLLAVSLLIGLGAGPAISRDYPRDHHDSYERYDHDRYDERRWGETQHHPRWAHREDWRSRGDREHAFDDRPWRDEYRQDRHRHNYNGHRRDHNWRRHWRHGWSGHRYRAPIGYHYPHGHSHYRWRIGHTIAYSEPSRPLIPTQAGHPFRSMPATIPTDAGHPLGRA